jgi:hypothetical protein
MIMSNRRREWSARSTAYHDVGGDAFGRVDEPGAISVMPLIGRLNQAGPEHERGVRANGF